jgi:serine/threonine protein kinase
VARSVLSGRRGRRGFLRGRRGTRRKRKHEDEDVTEDVPVAAEGRSSGKTTSELQFHWSHGEGLHLGNSLGSGTYGAVFSAKFLGMCFAVKVPRKTPLNLSEAEVAAGANAGASPMALRDVARELLGGHPNVVKAYAVLTSTSGQPGLGMEAAESSFDEWMRVAKLPTSPTPAANEIWLRLGQILHGLTYLHAKCILHCNLKESNVLCFPQGRMALADLGISRWLTEDSVICRGNEVYTLDYRPVEALHARASKAGTASVFFFAIFPQRLCACCFLACGDQQRQKL